MLNAELIPIAVKKSLLPAYWRGLSQATCISTLFFFLSNTSICRHVETEEISCGSAVTHQIFLQKTNERKRRVEGSQQTHPTTPHYFEEGRGHTQGGNVRIENGERRLEGLQIQT